MSGSSSRRWRCSKRLPVALSSSVTVPSGDGDDADQVALDRAAVAGLVAGGLRRGQLDGAGAEAVELDDRRLVPGELDEAPPAAGEEVDHAGGPFAGAETLERPPLQVRHRALELLVADEHVAVDLVARATADRVVRVALEQLPPREPEVGDREPLACLERPERGQRLDLEQPALGALVGALEIHPGRVDTPEHVLEAAAEQLARVCRQAVGGDGGHVVGEAGDRETRARQPALELRAQRRQVGSNAPVVLAVTQEHLAHARTLQCRPELLGDVLDPGLSAIAGNVEVAV